MSVWRRERGGARSTVVARMLRRLHEFYRRHIVANVPIGMDLCLDCGELECSQARFAKCSQRQARAAELAALIAKDKFEREAGSARPSGP